MPTAAARKITQKMASHPDPAANSTTITMTIGVQNDGRKTSRAPRLKASRQLRRGVSVEIDFDTLAALRAINSFNHSGIEERRRASTPTALATKPQREIHAANTVAICTLPTPQCSCVHSTTALYAFKSSLPINRYCR